MSETLDWFKVLDHVDLLPEGRVTSVTAGNLSLCLLHYDHAFYAMENKCPHQGGPLGEGSIEKGLLRCPWHGWDFDPKTGKSPGDFEDEGIKKYPVKIKDQAVYVGVEKPKAAHRTVSNLMVDTMLAWGVDTVFGMVGHSNLGLASAFQQAVEKGKLKYYGIRHEGAGAFAASAYGKLTGKPAACFSIAGPGATNMFTGLWDAKVDRAPILALTGQVTTQVFGTHNFQEIDLVEAYHSVAAFNHRVQYESPHSELMALAIKHALTNRTVSHLTFPDEIQVVKACEKAKVHSPEGRIPSQKILPPQASFKAALQRIRQAKRPVIIVGYGARKHMEEIIMLAERLNAPIMTTFKGKGLISDKHPLGCGVLGRSGTPVASWFMNEADLLIVFGSSFSNHTGITDHKPTIQIDFDPNSLAKFHAVDLLLWGEIGVTAQRLNKKLGTKLSAMNQRADIRERWQIWRIEKAKRLLDRSAKGLSSIAVFDTLSRLAPEDAVLCVDVGNNAYSFGRYFESQAQSFLMSGYLGSIGFAFPAALGAYAAVGHTRPIIAVAGDGGFGQYMTDFTTAVKYNMPIKLILLNNSELGKISKEQRAGQYKVWETNLVNPSFAAFAENCGALGVYVDQQDALESSMLEILAHQGPALLEIRTAVALL